MKPFCEVTEDDYLGLEAEVQELRDNNARHIEAAAANLGGLRAKNAALDDIGIALKALDRAVKEAREL